MYAYEVVNKITGEERTILGYNKKDAWRRCPNLNPDDWYVRFVDYLD